MSEKITVTTNPYAHEFKQRVSRHKRQLIFAIIGTTILAGGIAGMVGYIINENRPYTRYDIKLNSNSNNLLDNNGNNYSLNNNKMRDFHKSNFEFKTILSGTLNENEIGKWSKDNEFSLISSSFFYSASLEFINIVSQHHDATLKFQSSYRSNLYQIKSTLSYKDEKNNAYFFSKSYDLKNPYVSDFGWIEKDYITDVDSNITPAPTTICAAFGYASMNVIEETIYNGVTLENNPATKIILNSSVPFDADMTLASPYIEEDAQFSNRNSYVSLLSSDRVVLKNNFSYHNYKESLWEQKIGMFEYAGKSNVYRNFIKQLVVMPSETPIKAKSSFNSLISINSNAILVGQAQWNNVRNNFATDEKVFNETADDINRPSYISPIDYPYMVTVANASTPYILYMKATLVDIDYQLTIDYFNIVKKPNLQINGNSTIIGTPGTGGAEKYNVSLSNSAVSETPISTISWSLNSTYSWISFNAPNSEIRYNVPAAATAGNYTVSLTAAKSPDYNPTTVTVNILVS